MTIKSTHHRLNMTTPAPAPSPPINSFLQRKCACGGSPGIHGECAECRSKRLLSQRSPVQPKLTINEPGDRYEREADRVADMVMKMPEENAANEATGGPVLAKPFRDEPIDPKISRVIQRQVGVDEEEDEEEEELVQAKEQPGQTPTVDACSEAYIRSLPRRGQPLDPATRGRMAARFGHDFSHVRVHTDALAAESAGVVNAQAYTVGRHVVFAAGEHAPQTGAGLWLLAHELTHVVQQSSPSAVQAPPVMNRRQGADERETDAIADQVMRGVQPIKARSQQPGQIQRQVVEQPQEHIQPGAEVCMVHMHGDEQNSLRAAQALFRTRCANLVHLNNTTRCITVNVPGHGGSCTADPNRIFSTDSVTRANALSGSCPCPGSAAKRRAAVTEIRRFRTQVFAPAISRCRDGNGVGLSGRLPVVAFHNNNPGLFSIQSYQRIDPRTGRRGSEFGATETDQTRLGRTSPTAPAIANPEVVAGQDIDDFFLVTDPRDFAAFQGSRNVVLQASSPTDDGSLSVALRSERYINVETQDKRATAVRTAFNIRMAREALDQLGVSHPPCNAPLLPSTGPGVVGAVIDVVNAVAHALKEVFHALQRELSSIVPALPRETPPATLPRRCLPPFNNQADLDTRKTHWSGVINGMADRDVIRWIIGVASPPRAASREATTQKDCLLAAIRASSRGPRSPIVLPSGSHTISARRSFSHQERIWLRKFRFSGNPFDRISDHARQTCGSLSAAGDIQWDPRNPAHRVCWGVPPRTGTTAPALPAGARALTDDEKQKEILQASSAPGISRHHFGSDFDILDPGLQPEDWEVGGPLADEYGWLQRNASTYGFIQSFTSTSGGYGVGYIEERWHWSYYPLAHALLDFARAHTTQIEAELTGRWGTRREFSFVSGNWKDFMFNVSDQARF